MFDFPYDERKTAEIANLLLQFFGGLLKADALYAALYLIDREALRLWERPVTWDTYRYGGGKILAVNTTGLAHEVDDKRSFWRQAHAFDQERDEFSLVALLPLKALNRAEVDIVRGLFRQYQGADGLLDALTQLPEFQYQIRQTGSLFIPLSVAEMLRGLGYSEQAMQEIDAAISDERFIAQLLDKHDPNA